MTFKIKNSEDIVFMTVVGFTKSSENSVLLHGSGYVRNLYINYTMAIFQEINQPDKIVDTPPRNGRRLKQKFVEEEQEQLIFANEQEIMQHHYEEEEHGRKLGFFSALMTSGSFMMMQAGAF